MEIGSLEKTSSRKEFCSEYWVNIEESKIRIWSKLRGIFILKTWLSTSKVPDKCSVLQGE